MLACYKQYQQTGIQSLRDAFCHPACSRSVPDRRAFCGVHRGHASEAVKVCSARPVCQGKTPIRCGRRVLSDAGEDAMVRHEAAEALGAIADERALALLAAHAADAEPIVADSCLVALDMLEHERSGSFQYVDLGEKHGAGAGAGATVGEGAVGSEEGGKAAAGPGTGGVASANPAGSREALEAERWAGGGAAGVRAHEAFQAGLASSGSAAAARVDQGCGDNRLGLPGSWSVSAGRSNGQTHALHV